MKTQEQGELYDEITLRAFNTAEAREANERLVDVLDFLEGLLSPEILLEVTRNLDEGSKKIKELEDHYDAEFRADRMNDQRPDALDLSKLVCVTDDLRELEARSLEIVEYIEQEVLS